MTENIPPRRPPPLPKRPPSLEEFRPQSERTGSPLQQLRPPNGQLQRPRPPTDRSAMRRDQAQPLDRRSWLASLLIWGGIGSVGAVAAAAIGLMVWSPAGLVRDQLIARVKAKTGRDLVIAGPTSIAFYPNLAISMADVSLSAPPGMGGEPTIKMQTLEAAVPLVPLLSKQINVERLVMRRPVIDLRIDAKGRRSWEFASTEGIARVRYAQAGAGRPAAGAMPKELQDFVKSANPDSVEASISKGPLAALDALALEDVRIESGTVRYADARKGIAEEIQNLDAKIALAGLSSALGANGSLVWHAEPIAFDIKLNSPKLLTEERPARLVLKASGRPLSLDYDGAVTLGRAAEVEGAIDVRSPSLKSLFAAIGLNVPMATGGNAASLKGRLKASEQSVTLSDATAMLDQLTATGTLTVEPRPTRPLVRGSLRIAELDLNALALPTVTTPPPASPALRPAAAPMSAPAKPAQTIEDLLRAAPAQPGPRVQGYTRRSGWSDDVIDLSAFRLADADLKLSLGRLIYRDIKVGETHMRVALKERALTATFDDIQLYDGRGRGLLTIDGAAAVPALGANFSVDGTAAMALLKDAANFDWVAGKANVNVALGGQGHSERQIVGTLNGKVDVQFRDGAVIGYNVAQIVSNIGQGRFSGLERNLQAKTDFSEMAASFTIQNGIATNKDLRLISPMLRVTGAGTANMPERTLDYVLRPKLASAGAAPADAGGLEVPVKLAGSWDKPVIAADLDAVLKNPDRAIETVKKLGDQLKKSNPEAVDKAKALLNQFLKR